MYVVLGADEPSTNHRLIESYEARIESLERALELEREANRENRRLLAAALERLPRRLEAPEPAAKAPEGEEEPRTNGGGAQEGTRRPWWRRVFGG